MWPECNIARGHIKNYLSIYLSIFLFPWSLLTVPRKLVSASGEKLMSMINLQPGCDAPTLFGEQSHFQWNVYHKCMTSITLMPPFLTNIDVNNAQSTTSRQWSSNTPTAATILQLLHLVMTGDPISFYIALQVWSNPKEVRMLSKIHTNKPLLTESLPLGVTAEGLKNRRVHPIYQAPQA